VTSRSNASTGILLFLASVTCASATGGLSKILVQELPTSLILCVRFSTTVVIVGLFALAYEKQTLRWPRQPLLLTFRGLLLTGSASGAIIALRGMPLADSVSILFIYPFVVTAAAPLVLKEKVSGRSWIAVILGFAGVLIVLRPGAGGHGWYGVAAAIGGASYGFHLLATRHLAASTPPLVTAIWTSVVSAVFFSAALPFTWQRMNSKELILLLLIGLFTAASQLFTVLACTRTEISRLAPFGYAEIIGATFFGFILFQDIPDVLAWLGIVIIILSGIYLAVSAREKLPLVSRSRPPG
jgi:RarD protein